MDSQEKHQLVRDNWHKTYQEIAEITGYSPEYVRKLGRKKLGLPPKSVKQTKKTEEILTEDDMLHHLLSKGYTLRKHSTHEDKEHQINITNISGESFKVGIVSDTHLCSKYQQLSHLHSAYKYCKKQGINTILNCGDIVAGNGKVYRGQEYELFRHGADAQVDYAVENYPSYEGITTYFIAGNHDLSFMKSDGIDIMRQFNDRRKDVEYLGHYGAYITINGIRIYLHHGDGGVSYARSYKLQKLIEQLAPHNKPHIALFGHWHITVSLKMYRNVYGVAVGCFESQTPYLRRKGLYPEIGFTILEITKNDSGVVGVKEEWFPFFVPIDEDY